MKCKVYALKEPNSNVIKYIGMTKRSLEDRLYCHLKFFTSQRLNIWLSDLKLKNIIPEIVLLEEFENNTGTNKREVYYMNKYKDTILNKNFKIVPYKYK